MVSVALAQDDPNRRTGLQAGTSYSVGTLDAVNVFNGNLSLRIPLRSYPVDAALSYGLVLFYNHNVWELGTAGGNPTAAPDPFSNAGLGWRLSLGELLDPNAPNNDTDEWLLVEPDGSKRTFHDKLHDTDNDDSGNVYHTRDGSYHRLKVFNSPDPRAGERDVESPNGMIRTFDEAEGNRLTRIADRFGNEVTIGYEVDAETSETIWRITDEHGRQQVVTFHAPTAAHAAGQVESVQFTAFDLGTATYSFTYSDEQISTHRQVGGLELVSFLEQLMLPDGSSYEMDYHTTNSQHVDMERGIFFPELSGAIESLTLPTLGRVEWEYGLYLYANSGSLPIFLQQVEGVRDRRYCLPEAPQAGELCDAGHLLGRWMYDQQSAADQSLTLETVIPSDDEQVNHSITHHFALEDVTESPSIVWYHGLPFDPTIAGTDPQRFLSKEIRDKTGAVVRQIWARYTADENATRTYGNQRLEYSQSVYKDDFSLFSEVHLTDFDGLGHFRTATTNGTFGGDRERVETTNFNPNRGIYDFDANANGFLGAFRTNTYLSVSNPVPWVLGLFDTRQQTENGATARQDYCFDGTTGFLEGIRARESDTVLLATDLLVRFQADADGNVELERYYGGDNAQISTSDSCGSGSNNSENDQFGFHHTYEYGSLKTTNYLTSIGGDHAVQPVDREIDFHTGLPSSTTDISSEITTTFEYDTMGRLTWVRPEAGEGAWVERKYVVATGGAVSQLATIDVFTRPNGSLSSSLARSRQRFDGFGRRRREEVMLPTGVWSNRDLFNNVLGWPTVITERSDLANPVHGTGFRDYDPFGRPGTIRPPDGSGHDVVFRYSGDRIVERDTKVALEGGEAVVTTTEAYDSRGRLRFLQEPSGTSGAQVITEYDYDVGDRLASVLTTLGQPPNPLSQSRAFHYDHRGLLQWENHPEKGPLGYSDTHYCDYTARGHVQRRYEGGVPGCPAQTQGEFDVIFEYDRAERLTQVDETNGQILKDFEYGDKFAGRRKAKLIGAVRHNHVDTGSAVEDFVVREDYFYDGLGGRISRRDTSVDRGTSPVAEWTQSYGYHELGNVASIVYPCPSNGVSCSQTPPSVDYGYTNGWLTSIPGYATSISYHDNGYLDTIVHTNGMHYVHEKDPNDMQRPASIATGFLGPPATPQLPYTYDGAGNVKTINGETYVYDGVSRLVKGTLGTGDAQDYEYDELGNLTEIGRTPVGGARQGQEIDVDPTTNHIVGATYDGAGNVTGLAGSLFTWDALSSMTNYLNGAVDSAFVYTADDERIAVLKKGVGDFPEVWSLRGLDGLVLQQFSRGGGEDLFRDGFESGNASCWSSVTGGSSSGTCVPTIPLVPLRGYVYRAGRLLASIEDDDSILHYHLDHLGTPRLITDNKLPSAPEQDGSAYFPFGEELDFDGLAFEVPMKFTGHERDLGDLGGVTPGDDDLDYMHARYYSPLFGRFLSTDPIVASDPLLPQSWNQYSYAYANPVNFIDLFGLFECGGGSCEDEITVIAEAGDELLGVDALLDHINQSLIPDFGIDLGEQTLGEFLSSVNEAGGTRACVSYDCRMLQIVGSADEDPLLKAIEGGAALNTSLLLGAMKIPAVRPIPATGRLGQAFVRSSLARRLFGKSRYLNTGRHLRIGFGRGEQGGRLVFRIGGDFLRKLGVRSGKIDLIDFGQIPRF